MTTGSTANGMLDSGSGSAVEDASIANKKIFNDSENASPITKLVDVHRKRVVDEKFRLAVEKLIRGIATLPNNWNDLTVREQRDWLYVIVKNQYPTMPERLILLCVATTVNGDFYQASAGVPEWLDHEKFQRGQRFALDNFAGISFAEMLALYMLFSFEHGLRPLIVSGKSSNPFTSFKRYLSTANRVRNWYSSDVWTEGTVGHRDMQMVRKMHANMRNKMDASNFFEIKEAATIQNSWSTSRAIIREDFRGSCQIPAPGQCPYMYSEEDQDKEPKGLNQGEMASTQFGFIALVILYPESVGIHGASDEDLDAFCHVWRGLGYLLGIEDEFNFCNGTLEEIRQRSRIFIEYWVKPNLREITPEWEHMMRCLMEGISYYFPVVTYEHCLLYLAEILDIRMPRLRASLSWATWARLSSLKVTFKWTARLPGVPAVMSRCLVMCMNRGLKFTDEELAVLRERSEIILTKGTAETAAVKKDVTMAPPTGWLKAPIFVFSWAILLLNLPIILKEYARKLTRVDARSALPLS